MNHLVTGPEMSNLVPAATNRPQVLVRIVRMHNQESSGAQADNQSITIIEWGIRASSVGLS